MKRRLLFTLLAVAGALGALETAARTLPRAVQPERGIVMPPHPTRGWTLRTPSDPRRARYRATPDGLRAPKEPGDPDAPLVLTTGDSSIFGDGLEDGETIHDQLQAELSRRGLAGRAATLGVPGYSTEQTGAVLEEAGWKLAPRLLVVANLWSDSNTERLRDRDLLAASSSVAGRAELALTGSALFYELRARINAARGLPATRKVTWPVLGARGLRRVPLRDYAANLARILEGARERGVGVIVLALANENVIRGDREAQPWTPYFAVQAATAEAFGVPLLRAQDAFAGAGPGEVLHDGLHPNASGARRLAEALAAKLAETGWPASVPLPREAAAVAVPEDPWDGRERPRERSAVRDVLETDP